MYPHYFEWIGVFLTQLLSVLDLNKQQPKKFNVETSLQSQRKVQQQLLFGK